MRDFLVKQNGDRYSVGPVRMPSNRGNLLQQHFSINRLDEGDIRYTVPVDGVTLPPFTVRGQPSPLGYAPAEITNKENIPDEREEKGRTKAWENIVYLHLRTMSYTLPKIKLDADLKRILPRLQRELRDAIFRGPFCPRAKRALHAALQVKIGKKITLSYKDPKVRYLLSGRRVGPMQWLQRAKRPIPIETPGGGVIFRWATARSLARGGWVHPGTRPNDLAAKVKERRVPIIQATVRQSVAAQIKKSWGRKRKLGSWGILPLLAISTTSGWS
jgi:hypothetical protein